MNRARLTLVSAEPFARRPNVRATILPVDMDRLCAALGAELCGAQGAVQMLRTRDHDSADGHEVIEDLEAYAGSIAAQVARIADARRGAL